MQSKPARASEYLKPGTERLPWPELDSDLMTQRQSFQLHALCMKVYGYILNTILNRD